MSMITVAQAAEMTKLSTSWVRTSGAKIEKRRDSRFSEYHGRDVLVDVCYVDEDEIRIFAAAAMRMRAEHNPPKLSVGCSSDAKQAYRRIPQRARTLAEAESCG